MILLNVFNSQQSFDKGLAIAAQLRSMGLYDAYATVLNNGALKINSKLICEMIEHVSDEIIVLDHKESGCRGLPSELSSRGTPIRTLTLSGTRGAPFSRVLRSLTGFRNNLDFSSYIREVALEGLHLLKSHTGSTYPLCLDLVSYLSQHAFKYLIYFKGIYPLVEDHAIYFEGINKEPADLFLTFFESHNPVFQQIGYRNTHCIGVPAAYPAWRQAIAESSTLTEMRRVYGNDVAIVFTRGEQQTQVGKKILDLDILEIVSDTVDAFNELSPGTIVLIKPHPSQKMGVLEKAISGKDNAFVVHEHPAVLSALGRVCVSTWTSAVTDAFYAGLPCIEYFRQNELFRKIHPNGSPFRLFGIPSVSDGKAFRHWLGTTLKDLPRQSSVSTLPTTDIALQPFYQ